MARQNPIKINQLLKIWPRGTVAVYPWLQDQGISRKLVEQYIKSGWLASIGRGAVIIEGDSIDWLGGVYTLQKQLERKIHVGSATALALKGRAHFMSFQETVCLIGAPREALPKWFLDYDWDAKIDFRTRALFSSSTKQPLSKHKHKEFEMEISSPEQAILEFLDEIPQTQSWAGANLIMEGLPNLRPRLVQSLLETCDSIKTKRLFLALAEKYKFPWFEKIDQEKIDLGSGKRVIYKDGRLHPKYQITLPEKDDGWF